jgi:hypothetical protein
MATRKTEPSTDPLDEEIRNLSRNWTTRALNLLTLARLELIRDQCRELVKAMDRVAKQARKAGVKRLGPRPAEYIPECEALLRLLLGSDINRPEKLTEFKNFVEGLLVWFEKWPAEPKEQVLWKTAAEFEKFFRVMTRKSPGRKPDPEKRQRDQEGLRMHEESGHSYERIARNLDPEDFKKSPARSRAKIRQGIERLKKSSAKTKR